MGLKLNRQFLAGSLFSLLLLSCGGASFHYYGLRGVQYEQGTLLGPKEGDDIPFSRCQPTEQVRNPCIVMFAVDFYALKQDYQDTKSKLKACEAKLP